MLKPTSTYKMSKTLKTSLALSRFQDVHLKGQWKRAMIDAELSSKIVVKPEKKERRNTGGNYQVTETSAVSVE
jgi:hypothetical protein